MDAVRHEATKGVTDQHEAERHFCENGVSRGQWLHTILQIVILIPVHINSLEKHMKNPCKECLLINNCTAICWEKTNFKKLLENAMRSYGFGFRTCNSQHRKLYLYYKNLLEETRIEMAAINHRADRLKLNSTGYDI